MSTAVHYGPFFPPRIYQYIALLRVSFDKFPFKIVSGDLVSWNIEHTLLILSLFPPQTLLRLRNVI